MSHDDRAADVLAEAICAICNSFWIASDDEDRAGDIIDALAAAGLAVVRVGEPPPWMEQPHPDVLGPAGTIAPYWRTSDGAGAAVNIYPSDARDDDLPLYRLTEGNDR